MAEQEKPQAAPLSGEPQAEPPITDPDLPKDEAEQMTSLHERGIAALSYVGFLAIVPFYLKKNSKFCRFHGKQGLLVAIIFFFAKLLLVIDLFMDVALVLQFLIFVKMGFAALSGKWAKMPWIYDSSCKLAETLSLEAKEEEKTALSGKE